MTKKVYLAPGHGRRPNGTMDPGASGGGTTEQEAGDACAREVERLLLANYSGVTVRRQPRGGPNFSGTRNEIDSYGPDIALELHHDWVKAPRGGFGFHRGGVRQQICDVLRSSYVVEGLPVRNHMASLPGTNSEPGLYGAKTAAVVLWEIDRIGTYTPRHALAIANGIAAFLDLKVIKATPKPPAPAPTAPRDYVTVGDKGARVREWQQLLISKGFPLPRWGADGDFGAETLGATLAAYRAVGLTASNPAEPRVGDRSFAALRAHNPTPPFRFRHRTGLLRHGSRGAAVAEWQGALRRWNRSALPRFGADGDFGAETDDWTRRFQRAARVAPDGIVGPATRTAMEQALNR